MRELDWRSFPVVVVDDEEDNLDAFRFAFRKSFDLHFALGGPAALALLEKLDPAVVVSDQRMPGMSGVDLLERARALRPDVVGVLLTAYADLPVLIDALNSGAVERYVQKPWDSKELTVILRQAIAKFATVRENRRLREQLALYAGYLEQEQRDPIDFGELGGASPAVRALGDRIAEVAPTTAPVVLIGEPGSEAEVVARAIHVGSPREGRPFVKIPGTAYRGEALERELFGWTRGAFDGAFDDRAGRLELAHGGTAFLADPDPPSARLQERLLELIDRGESQRVGATAPSSVDVRLVLSVPAAQEETWRRTVLPDLWSRLAVYPLRLPPLRERPADLRPLAEHFLRKFARRNPRAATTFSEGSLAKLAAHPFPGNLRELENVVERAAIVSRGDEIREDHVTFGPPPLATTETPSRPPPADLGPGTLDSQLDRIERQELLAALRRHHGNKAEVARALGVQRTTLYYRLKRLGIET